MALRTALLGLGILAFGADAQMHVTPSQPFSIFGPATDRELFFTKESLYEVYQSAEDFLSRWPRQETCDDSCARGIAAHIDFSREMLILIAPRARGQETYDVVIHTAEDSDDAMLVHFIELRHGTPRDGLMCGILLTAPQPAVALLVPQSSKPVRFLRRRADVICEHEVQVK